MKYIDEISRKFSNASSDDPLRPICGLLIELYKIVSENKGNVLGIKSKSNIQSILEGLGFVCLPNENGKLYVEALDKEIASVLIEVGKRLQIYQDCSNECSKVTIVRARRDQLSNNVFVTLCWNEVEYVR